MTLITPLMISLSAGVFEFGNLIHKKLLIEAGLRDAARYVARCNPDFSGLACETIAARIAVTGTTDASGAARVSGWTVGSVSVDRDFLLLPAIDENGDVAYRSATENVLVARVTTSFTYTGMSLLLYLGFSPITLTGSHEERVFKW